MGTARSVLVALFVALVLPPAAGAAAPISDVRHEPAAPKPGATVLVTARLAKGVTKPVLRIQAVAPGKYVRRSDPAYEKDWTDLPMRDDGKGGDEKAGDGVFTARVPAATQRHRWLIRYRVVATDANSKPVRAPQADDDCPNFAWWCDAGPAAWKGSRQPGKSPVVTYPAAFLGTRMPCPCGRSRRRWLQSRRPGPTWRSRWPAAMPTWPTWPGCWCRSSRATR